MKKTDEELFLAVKKNAFMELDERNEEFYLELFSAVKTRTLKEREKNQILIDLYADITKCWLFEVIKLNYLENLNQDSTYRVYSSINNNAFTAKLKASVEKTALEKFKREFVG